MAYLGVTGEGRRYVQVDGRDGRRKTIGLGSIGKRKAEQVRRFIEDLAASVRTGTTPEPGTRQWLASVDGKLRRRLVELGLAEPGALEAELGTLGPFVDACIERQRGTVKAGTMRRLEQAKRSLLSYFKPERALHGITEADAEDYLLWLRLEAPHRRRKADGRGEAVKGLAEATAGKRCKDARQWFAYAVRLRLIERNPFEAVTCASPATEHRAYIGEADARAVLNKLPDAGWRLLFALARWGGLRTASEPRALRWSDVDWERGRLLVRSPKTEHLAGHAMRTVPLFAEIEGPLREEFELAEEGEPLVLPWLSDRTDAALRKPLQRAIERAGVKPWRRLWHNLRSTRQTELERHFSTHVVCAWLGNSASVASKHYLQVTDDDFTAARVLGERVVGLQRGAVQSAALMHGQEGTGGTKTALAGPRRDIGGQVDRQNDPYGERTPSKILRKNSVFQIRRRRIRRSRRISSRPRISCQFMGQPVRGGAAHDTDPRQAFFVFRSMTAVLPWARKVNRPSGLADDSIQARLEI